MNKLVNLKDNNDILIPKVFQAIDTSNLIANLSGTENGSYTATIDCLLIISVYTNISNMKINNNTVFDLLAGGSSFYLIPLKNGQTITFTSYSAYTIKVYGIKY